jgi:hypothetical protein
VGPVGRSAGQPVSRSAGQPGRLSPAGPALPLGERARQPFGGVDDPQVWAPGGSSMEVWTICGSRRTKTALKLVRGYGKAAGEPFVPRRADRDPARTVRRGCRFATAGSRRPLHVPGSRTYRSFCRRSFHRHRRRLRRLTVPPTAPRQSLPDARPKASPTLRPAWTATAISATVCVRHRC